MCVSKYNHNDTDLLTTNRSSLFFSYVCECTHNDTDNDQETSLPLTVFMSPPINNIMTMTQLG